MSDLIDRQMALDAIMGQPPEPHYPSWYAAQIKKLPAVQPDHNADISKKAEGDTISRQAAIDALARMMPRSYTPDGSHPADEEIFRAQEVFADCIEALEILPSARPEIIRCKDCKYSSPNGKHGCKSYHYRLYETHEMKPDDFCSFAERRTDGQCKSD